LTTRLRSVRVDGFHRNRSKLTQFPSLADPTSSEELVTMR
jgi:hypothetical protein